MLDQIAAYTAASLTPAGQKRAKGLWKHVVNDETHLAHVVTAAGRIAASSVVGATVRAPRTTASETTAPLTGLTIRQQTLDDRWHSVGQTDLLVLTEIRRNVSVLLQAPPGFGQQVALPPGRYRIVGIRLALSDELTTAAVLALAAVTVAPFERLPLGWTEPAQLPRYVHSQPVTVGAPTTVDLAFVGAGEHGELPATFGDLLATGSARRAA